MNNIPHKEKTYSDYLEEAYKDTLEESGKLYIEASSDDLLDLDLPVAMPLYGGLHSIRNADIREDKLYLDEEKENVRYSYINKQDGNPRNEAVILLKPDENRLSNNNSTPLWFDRQTSYRYWSNPFRTTL